MLPIKFEMHYWASCCPDLAQWAFWVVSISAPLFLRRTLGLLDVQDRYGIILLVFRSLKVTRLSFWPLALK